MKTILILTAAALGTACTPQTTHTMTDPQATAQTRALYANLYVLPEKGILFGHQDDTAYGIGWSGDPDRSDVKSVTGQYPAVYGWELGGIERGAESNLDSVPFARIRSLAVEAYGRGGVNTMSWHADNLVTGGDTWDLTGGNVVATLLPGGTNHAQYLQNLTIVGEFFASLTTAQGELVPVLFRPLHEHTGSWFWWGRDFCTADQYKALWRMTVGHLRDTMGLRNLIYVYSPDRVADTGEYLERYPGDEWVDVLGLDLYHFNGEQGVDEYRACVERSLGVVDSLAGVHGKPYAFTETGSESIPMPAWFNEVLYLAMRAYRPAYVLVWRNSVGIPNHYYAPYPGHASCDDFRAFSLRNDILFEAEIPNMYQ